MHFLGKTSTLQPMTSCCQQWLVLFACTTLLVLHLPMSQSVSVSLRIVPFSLSTKILSHLVTVKDPYVDIECRLNISANDTRYFAVNWERNSTVLAENGIAYSQSAKYNFSRNAGPFNSTVFVMRINNIAWTDSGTYWCFSVNYRSAVYLNVTAPPRRIVSFVAAVSPPSPTYRRRAGLELGSSDGLILTCLTDCAAADSPARIGFQPLDRVGPAWADLPPADIRAPLPLPESLVSGRFNKCDGLDGLSASAMTWGEVAVRLDNCSQLGLDGRTRFYCITDVDVREALVHCPVIYRDFPPTRSETVAASVGSAVGLALIGLGFFIFCRRPRRCQAGAAKSDKESVVVRPVNL